MTKRIDQFKLKYGEPVYSFVQPIITGGEQRFTVFVQEDCLGFVREIRRQGEEEYHDPSTIPGFAIEFDLEKHIMEAFKAYHEKTGK